MRRFFTVLILCAALAAAQEASQRSRQNFDFDWKFTLGDPADAEKPTFNDNAWRKLDLPHDWSIEGTWAADNPSGSAGGYAALGLGWYRKTFRLPAEFSGRRIFVEFDGVFNRADVWVNGQKVGHNEYGYIGFECDLTPWVRFGRDNVIAVRVDNLRQASRWYTGSGIYRHVWLTATDPLHVAHWGTYVATPEISERSATVRVATTVRNDSDTQQLFTVVTKIDGANAQSEAEVRARGLVTVTQEITVPSPQRWSPESPRLYTAITQVIQGQRVADEYRTPFGIRTIAFDVHQGFTLNGKRIILKGVCLHHDLGALGAAALEAGIERRLRILMSMGVNAVRLSHNPYSPEMLALCDRLGLIVFDEAYDKWYGFLPDGTGWDRDLRSFVERDRNHPSVVIWSVGNEMTPHMYKREGTLLYQAMSALVKQLDPTRPVTAALHPVRNDKGERDAPLAEIAQFMDVISMNYQTRFYARDHGQHPNQPLLGSETHVHQHNIGGENDPKNGSGNQWFGTRDYTTNQYVDYVAGQFTWAGIDYLGESGPWPSKASRTNLVDTAGFRKPFSYYEQSLYTDSPMVSIAVDNPAFLKDKERYRGSNWAALAAHWNWPPELKTLKVFTFTNAPSVELLLNDKSLGEKRLVDFADRIIWWAVPNEPGTLVAVAKKDGKQVAIAELPSAGKAVRLVLVPDRRSLEATGQDLSHIEVRMVDEKFILVPTVTPVRFEISGPGTIAGVDNGDPYSPEPFKATQRETRDGRCLVIVQSSRQAGVIKLTAHTEGVPDASVEITTRALPMP